MTPPRSRRRARQAATAACFAVLAVVASYGFFSCGRSEETPGVPRFEQVREAHVPSDVPLLDRHGEVVHEVRVDDRGRSLAWVPLAAVSPALVDALIAAEDRRFAAHDGVDPRALAAAFAGRLLGNGTRGASTITMQLANLLEEGAPPRRALAAKWRQMRRAWAIERSWSKPEILEAYLNLVSFRGEVSGIGAAAGVLFAKRPHGLTPAEAIVLAVLPRGPNAPREIVERRAAALAARLGTRIAGTQIAAATALALDPDRVARPRVAAAPHLSARLLGEWRGRAGTLPPIRTTLDAALQRRAAEALERHLLALAERNVADGAVLVVDNASGDVLAYVGGRGATASAPWVDGVRARRQAGSTLKPFLYAQALEERLLTPASLLADAPLALPVAGGLYQPRNYDEGFRGLVSLRSALAASLNVPAVRTLELLSPDAFVVRLRRLGFAGVVARGDFYGPSLALGSAGVSLEELVAAYRTLANGGVATPLRSTRDSHAATAGAPATAPAARAGERVIPAEVAFVVADVLSDRDGRSATFGLDNALATRFWSAVKTGTSKEMRDNWCVGFSRRVTVGVWVGNSSGEPMHDVSGISGAAPVWRELMEAIHAADPGTPPLPPPGLVRAAVSFPGAVEPPREEWFLPGTEPRERAQLLAPEPLRIVSPQAGAVIALDPDVPERLERLAFAAAGGEGGRHATLRWVLDGRELTSAEHPFLWPPRAGKHRLELVAPDGAVLDRVDFEVRGGKSSTIHRFAGLSSRPGRHTPAPTFHPLGTGRVRGAPPVAAAGPPARIG